MGFSRGTLAVWATWNSSPTAEAYEAVAMVGRGKVGYMDRVHIGFQMNGERGEGRSLWSDCDAVISRDPLPLLTFIHA